jgi:hypothetical protein
MTLPSWLSIAAVGTVFTGVAAFFTTIVGSIATITILGSPIGQMLVNALQFVFAIITEFVKLVFDLMKTTQGRWVLFFACCAIGLAWAYFHIENKGWAKGYQEGVKYEKAHMPRPVCPAPAKRTR